MKFFKVTAIVLGILVALVLLAAFYVKAFLPDTGKPEELTIERTPERVARGQYLANHVTLCMDCHSTRDWSLFAGPMLMEDIGCGGEHFTKDMGFPGVFIAPNITPFRLENWTDGEIFHAVTTGVSKDGRALFPIMGYERFGKMDREDIYSIIAYIRTLKPVENEIPKSEPEFPVNFLINTMPTKAQFTKRPDESDKISYGAYIANAAGCVHCHSRTEKGQIIPGTEFGGGFVFLMPSGTVRSPNITPDVQTGIGSWTEEMFVGRFKAYVDSSYTHRKVQPDEMNTPMPWVMYGGMKASDLSAVYSYLRSLKPMTHKVVTFEKKGS